MSAPVSITLRGTELMEQRIQTMGRRATPAVRMALNTVTRKGKTMLVSSVRKQLNLKAAYVRDKVRLRLATSGGDLSAAIITEDRGLLLTRFGAKQRYRGRYKSGGRRLAGVTVSVKPGVRKVLPGAFFIRLKNGVMGVAIPDKGHYANGNRRADVLTGPSPGQVFARERSAMSGALGPMLEAEVARQLQREVPRS